jgi:hypothetical protein
MLFKKNDSANLVSKSTKYWKIVPRKRKKHKMLYLTWKVGFLYYFTVSNIFTDNLKLILNSRTFTSNKWQKPSRLLGKTLPWYSLKSILFCMLYISQFVRYYFFWYFMFSLCCMVFWPLYCVFETCKVKSVISKTLLKLYFERYSFTFHFTKFLGHFLKKLMLNRNYF